MNAHAYVSHADLGGQTGHGPVLPEPEDERFHQAWEPKALALTLAMGGTGSWNIDMSRAARETLPDYAHLSYYQIWLAALEKLMAERGQLMPDELAAGHMLHLPAQVARVLAARDVAAVLARGSATARATELPARFAIGDTVRTRPGPVDHHTRLPGYARGKRGRIARWHGAHVFADAHAQGLGEQPRHLYTVEFEGRELWGAESDAGLVVSIDAWQDYLEPA